jgi:hypothetical protein
MGLEGNRVEVCGEWVAGRRRGARCGAGARFVSVGLDALYLQAKRWSATIGRRETQTLAGALQRDRAKQGASITTSKFSREAEDYVNRIKSKIVLIDNRS